MLLHLPCPFFHLWESWWLLVLEKLLMFLESIAEIFLKLVEGKEKNIEECEVPHYLALLWLLWCRIFRFKDGALSENLWYPLGWLHDKGSVLFNRNCNEGLMGCSTLFDPIGFRFFTINLECSSICWSKRFQFLGIHHLPRIDACFNLVLLATQNWQYTGSTWIITFGCGAYHSRSLSQENKICSKQCFPNIVGHDVVIYHKIHIL